MCWCLKNRQKLETYMFQFKSHLENYTEKEYGDGISQLILWEVEVDNLYINHMQLKLFVHFFYHLAI
jgi:hypothetical protein